MKHKVGDFVNIKGRLTARAKENYRVDIQDNYIWVNGDCIQGVSKTYEDGLADAWELARKIADISTTKERADMFGYCWYGITLTDILRDFTYQEALAKIEAYGESKEIKVGDVVYSDDEPDSFGVVTWVAGKILYVMWDDGSCGRETEIEELHKTGRHIDIEHLLEQIRGNE